MSWQRVKGHEAIARAFEHVVRRGRLAHAYLFVGPAGVGKRLFANQLARALLCEQRPPSCGLAPAAPHVHPADAGAPGICGRPAAGNTEPIEIMGVCAIPLKSASRARLTYDATTQRGIGQRFL